MSNHIQKYNPGKPAKGREKMNMLDVHISSKAD